MKQRRNPAGARSAYAFQQRINQSQRSKYMNLSDWRQSRTETMTLPGGLEVTVKRVSIIDLIASGQVPNTLLHEVEALGRGGSTEINLEEMPKYATAINLIVKACLVTPPVADEPDAEHLGVNELPLEDRMVIFEWAQADTKKLQPFRAQPGSPVDNPQPGSDLPPATEQHPGD